MHNTRATVPQLSVAEVHNILLDTNLNEKVRRDWNGRYVTVEGTDYRLDALARTLNSEASPDTSTSLDIDKLLKIYKKTDSFFHRGVNKDRKALEKKITSYTPSNSNPVVSSDLADMNDMIQLRASGLKERTEGKNSFEEAQERTIANHTILPKDKIMEMSNAEKTLASSQQAAEKEGNFNVNAQIVEPSPAPRFNFVSMLRSCYNYLKGPASDCSSKEIQKFLDAIVDAPPAADGDKDAEAVYNTGPDTRLQNHTIAFCETKGTQRRSMEDRSLATTFDIRIGRRTYPVVLAGIFDGHDGDLAATYAKRFFQPMLKKRLEELNKSGLTEEGVANALSLTTVDLHEAWCKYCADKIQKLPTSTDWNSDESKRRTLLRAGTTSSVIIQVGDHWYTSNVGDSRILLVPPTKQKESNDETSWLEMEESPPVQMTADGTPENRESHILEEGGMVIQDRTSGKKKVHDNERCPGAACGGSIGDAFLGVHPSNEEQVWRIRDRGILSRGFVQIFSREDVPAGSRIVLACDGIYAEDGKEQRDAETGKTVMVSYKVASTKQVGDFVSKNTDQSDRSLAYNITRGVITAEALDNCTVGVMTVG